MGLLLQSRAFKYWEASIVVVLREGTLDCSHLVRLNVSALIQKSFWATYLLLDPHNIQHTLKDSVQGKGSTEERNGATIQ